MNRNEQKVYLAPEIEVNEVSVEQGFAASEPSSTDNNIGDFEVEELN